MDLPDSPSSVAADPRLSRNLSSSRLNAKAPEFVPARPQPPPPPHRIMVVPPPPPPPPPVVHVYPPPPPPFVHAPVSVPSPATPPHVYTPHHHQMPHRARHHAASAGEHQEHDGSAGSKKDHRDPNAGLSEDSTMKILNQVEYYFSDLNLATTDHLMRFINKDPDGYVPMSVVASFKKIKALIGSNSQLANVLRNSSKLEVSEDGKKVRRRYPLTESDMEELQSRVIIAENLPEDHCYQNLMRIFSVVGSVKTIRTCQPQPSSSMPSSASRSSKTDGMHFSNKLHAFVEYESVELAEKAVVELNDEGNWRSGLKVRLMLRRSSKSSHAKGRKGHDEDGHHEEADASTSEQLNGKQWEEHLQLSEQLNENLGEENALDKEGGQRKGRNRSRGKGRGRGHNNHSNNHNRGHHVGSPVSAASHMVSNEQANVSSKQPPGPRMPDGTRGFSMGRGKPVAVNTT